MGACFSLTVCVLIDSHLNHSTAVSDHKEQQFAELSFAMEPTLYPYGTCTSN